MHESLYSWSVPASAAAGQSASGSGLLIPALTVLVLLCGVRARIDVYAAFVRGARDGLAALVGMAPYLCAVLSAAALLRTSGVTGAMEAAGVVLLRPLSGSAALALVRDVIAQAGADSRAARFACVISGASETLLFTGSLYMGAAGVRRAPAAFAAALGAYAAGILAAALAV